MDIVGKVVFSRNSDNDQIIHDNDEDNYVDYDHDMHEDLDEEEEADNDDDDYYDYDDCELDEEYRKFIEITRKHQQERDRLKELNKKLEALTIYKDIRELDIQKLSTLNDNSQSSCESTYRQNYGELWQEIRSKELFLQNAFNKFWDEKKPSFWPTMPIHIPKNI